MQPPSGSMAEHLAHVDQSDEARRKEASPHRVARAKDFYHRAMSPRAKKKKRIKRQQRRKTHHHQRK